MNVGLTVKAELPAKDQIVGQIARILRAAGATLYIDVERCGELGDCQALDLATSPIETLVVIGGDGTIFRTVRELHGRDIPILGINRGGIGFLAEVDLDDVEEVVPLLLKGAGMRDRRKLLSISVERKGTLVFTGRALNEAVIAQGAIARLLDLTASVQDEPLTTYRADGLVISTPTGSTAYSLSAGGPIVHPFLGAIILTPLNPHTFSQKPIVLPGDQRISIEVLPKLNRFVDSTVSLTLDGQSYFPLERRDIVRVAIGNEAVTFLRRQEDTFFSALRKKLKWGERP